MSCSDLKKIIAYIILTELKMIQVLSFEIML